MSNRSAELVDPPKNAGKEKLSTKKRKDEEKSTKSETRERSELRKDRKTDRIDKISTNYGIFHFSN